MLRWRRALSLVNARIVTDAGEASSMRLRSHIVSIGERPQRGDRVLDLDGRFVLPGLINAHDHLELNHYGALKCRDRYDSASGWIDDLRPVIRSDPRIRRLSQYPLRDRLFIGGMKNLLAGVTFVAHHNPIYRAFDDPFPVRLLRRFGWAHSVAMEREPVGAGAEPGGVIAERAAATPSDRPFIVHAAEGTDAASAGEIAELERRGALGGNSVLVHGVGVPTAQWGSLFERGISLVWCPQSNLFLLGRTLCMPCLLRMPSAARRVCLGSDSRLTGGRDLLVELQTARACGVPPAALLEMVTTSAAQVLRAADAGRIAVGAPADIVVVPPRAGSAAESLLSCARADLALVVRGGTPVVGDVDMSPAFAARNVDGRPIVIDGRPKLMAARLVRRLERGAIQEPGVWSG